MDTIWHNPYDGDLVVTNMPFVDYTRWKGRCNYRGFRFFGESSRQGWEDLQISSRPHTSFGPQKVAIFGREMGPRNFQGNLGWWNIMSFGQINIYKSTNKPVGNEGFFRDPRSQKWFMSSWWSRASILGGGHIQSIIIWPDYVGEVFSTYLASSNPGSSRCQRSMERSRSKQTLRHFQYTTRWWLKRIFVFIPIYLEKWSSNFTSIFQMGWNHQLD